MIKIKISNPDLKGDERTYLTADYTSGTSLTVANTNSFQVNWFIVCGEPGQEKTELRRVTAVPSATALTIVSAFSFTHAKSSPVYRSHYDQVAVERRPSGGSFAEHAKYDIEWDNPDNMTFIAISAGNTTDSYRWRYYNTLSGEFTAYSDILEGTGLEANTLGRVITAVRRVPAARAVDDEVLMEYANDFQNVVFDEMPKAWWFQKEGTAVATAADTYKYAISSNWSDFINMKFLLYKYFASASATDYELYPLTYSPLNEFYNYKSDSSQASDDYVKYWTRLPGDSTSPKGYIGLHPTPKTALCFMQPIYHFEPTTINSFSDDLLVPSATAYQDYILYRIYEEIKSDTDNANLYDKKLYKNLVNLKRRARSQIGQQELFRYRGHRGWSKLYGDNAQISSQDAKELFW